jgi:hypothetical protein
MKFNYKLILVLVIALLSFTTARSQGKDKVEALRVSFISQKLNLSTQEAQGFWPLYNEYNDKIKSLRKNFRQQYGSVSEFKSDKEADDFLNAEMKMKQGELDLHKEYFEKIKKVLGSKKTAMLIRAEEEFKKVIIQTIKGNTSDS